MKNLLLIVGAGTLLTIRINWLGVMGASYYPWESKLKIHPQIESPESKTEVKHEAPPA